MAEQQGGPVCCTLARTHHAREKSLGCCTQSYASLPPRGSGSAPSSPAKSPTRRADGASAGALFAAGSGVQLAAVQEGSAICSVPVLMGSPRYLLLKKLFPEQALPPVPLMADGAECRLHYLVRGLWTLQGALLEWRGCTLKLLEPWAQQC